MKMNSTMSLKSRRAATLTWNTIILKTEIMFLLFLCSAFAINAYAEKSAYPPRQAAPLQLGLIPHLSSNLMMRKYQNLILYLEEQLNRTVVVKTAPDFKTYVQRSTQGRYDLYMTAPHMAIYHEKYDRHIRLVKFSNELRSVVAVRKDSAYKSIKDLKGKTISAASALAMNTLNGEITLKNNGLNIKNDINIKYTPSSNNPLFLLADARVDASITGLPAYKIVSASGKLKQDLRILKVSEPVPHMMFMCPQRVAKTECENLKSVLLNIGKHEKGKAFLSNVPFGDLVEVADEDIGILDGMLKILQQRLEK